MVNQDGLCAHCADWSRRIKLMRDNLEEVSDKISKTLSKTADLDNAELSRGQHNQSQESIDFRQRTFTVKVLDESGPSCSSHANSGNGSGHYQNIETPRAIPISRGDMHNQSGNFEHETFQDDYTDRCEPIRLRPRGLLKKRCVKCHMFDCVDKNN